MFKPVFTLNLNQKVLPGRVAIGEFDGRHPCIAAATTAEKVFIHNPHQSLSKTSSSSTGRMMESGAAGAPQELITLNVNQRVTALVAGQMDPEHSRDYLLIGTPTNLLAYDVEENADLFHKDVPDGVNAIAVGRLGDRASPLAVVGGNCSLVGFDHRGDDPFWTVTGDNVSALAVADYSGDGRNELLVGSEDFEIRVFSGDEIVTEITETEAVTGLVPVQDGRFGYALANGTVGVYEKTTRWWRIKSKNSATAIAAFDLDGDGVKEMVTGWSSGKLDARNDRSGEVVFKDNFAHPVAGLVEGDYRMDGKMELIAVTSEGEVRGYLPLANESQRGLLDPNVEQESIRELSQRRANLMLELKNYEENRRIAATSAGAGGSGGGGGGMALAAALMSKAGLGSSISSSSFHRDPMSSADVASQLDVGVIPAQTQLSTALAINLGTDGKPPHVEVSLSTSNDTVIAAVLIFAEGIFDGECQVLHPRPPSAAAPTIHVPVFPPKDVPVDLHIKAFVGIKAARQFHVFELTRTLPRFSMYCRKLGQSDSSPPPSPSPPPPPPEGFVRFRVNERAARVAIWLDQNFLMGEEMTADETGQLSVAFTSLRNKEQELHIDMQADGQVMLKCDNMELCGDVIQSLSEYLGLEDLQAECNFPEEITRLESLLEKADELQSVRQRLSAELADNSGLIRTLVVRAEDARLMMDMKTMRKWYTQLYDINRDLISGYKIRCSNHQELMDTLKMVNQVIQKAGRLRVGKSKARVITECRNAIKENNVAMLIKVIKTGGGSGADVP